MHKKSLLKNDESGITLVALIITIIILVVLSAISINALEGDDGIIDYSYESTEKYAKTQYEEQIYQLVEEIGRKYKITGEDINIDEMAQKMSEQEWIKSAAADNDIIVVTEKGYVYQVYYNEKYGQIFVEFLGIEDENDFPSVSISYSSQTGNITVSANDSQRIELYYNQNVVRTSNSTSLTYFAQDTGWYMARVLSNSSKLRYAWIRVSKVENGVEFKITSVGMQENGWYGKDNVPVQVYLSTNASKIYYKLGAAANYTEVQANNTNLSINTLGKTTIYAYSVDANNNESEISSIDIKFDNTIPVIGEINVEGETRANGGSYKSDVEISLNMTDTGSGIDGYSYWVVDGNVSNEQYFKGTEKVIIVKSNGVKKIAFQAKDKAGNLSTIQTVTITKEQIAAGERAKEDLIYVSGERKAIIPKGFTVSKKSGESSIENGLVIYRIPEDNTASDGDSDLTDAEIAAIDWTNSTVTESLRTTYDQFVWIPVDTPYVTAAEIQNIIDNQDLSLVSGSTDNQKAINYLISLGKYPMAVQLDDGVNYRGIFYNVGNGTVTSYNNFSTTTNVSYETKWKTLNNGNDNTVYATYNREPGMVCYDFGIGYNSSSQTYSSITNPNTIDLTMPKLQQEYNKRIQSAITNRGFWVGRYETNGITNNSADDNTTSAVKVVAGVTPSNSMNWYRMYAQQKTYINEIDSNYVGGMITGAEWDQMMIYLMKAGKNVTATTSVQHNGNNIDYFKEKPYKTGGTNYTSNLQNNPTITEYGDIWNNIYDLEGNVREWTIEVLGTWTRAARGGSYLVANSAWYRNGYCPSNTYSAIGSRVSLYVK